MIPDTAPRFGIVPVSTAPPFANVFVARTSATAAVQSEESTSYSQVPVPVAPLGKWNVTFLRTSLAVTVSPVRSMSVLPP